MTQYRFTDYFSFADPKKINDQFVGGVKAGFHNGFLVLASQTAGKLDISAGNMHTAEGIRICENEDLLGVLTIPINNEANPRWDRIVLRHKYYATYPNIAATYDIIQGKPSANPAVPDEPENCMTMAFGYLLPVNINPTNNYYKIINTYRDLEPGIAVSVTLGDGINSFGQYNGEVGLKQLFADYLNNNGAIFVQYIAGEIQLTDTLAIPPNIKIIGNGKFLAAAGKDTIKAAGFGSATGETQAGTKYLDDENADFTKYSINSLLRILVGQQGGPVNPDAGYYEITEIVGATRIALNAAGNFTGFSPTQYHLYAPGIELKGLAIVAEPGYAAIDRSYSKDFIIKCCQLSYSGPPQNSENEALFKTTGYCYNSHVRFNQAISIGQYAVNDVYSIGGSICDNFFLNGDIKINESCSDILVDRNITNGDIILASIDSGSFAKPFATEHALDGTHLLGSKNIKDRTITEAKHACFEISGRFGNNETIEEPDDEILLHRIFCRVADGKCLYLKRVRWDFEESTNYIHIYATPDGGGNLAEYQGEANASDVLIDIPLGSAEAMIIEIKVGTSEGALTLHKYDSWHLVIDEQILPQG